MLMKSKWPRVAHWAFTVAPSCSTSLLTSRIRAGLFLTVWTPSGVSVESMMYVGTAFLPGWLVDLGAVLSDPLGVMRCSGILMMRVSPTILAAGAALLVPHAAQAAYLAPIDPCYRSLDEQRRETVPVRASGFTPGEHVNVYVDGVLVQQDVVVLTDGQISGGVEAPYVAKGERPFTLTVTEVSKPSNTASVMSRVTALSLRLKPRRAAPQRRVRVIGRGFIDGDL